MKQKSAAPSGMGNMFPTGPSMGYSETRTFILTDGQGHTAKLIYDVPQKFAAVDPEELPYLVDCAAAYCKSEEDVPSVEIMKQKITEKERPRFDDDGSAWL